MDWTTPTLGSGVPNHLRHHAGQKELVEAEGETEA